MSSRTLSVTIKKQARTTNDGCNYDVVIHGKGRPNLWDQVWFGEDKDPLAMFMIAYPGAYEIRTLQYKDRDKIPLGLQLIRIE